MITTTMQQHNNQNHSWCGGVVHSVHCDASRGPIQFRASYLHSTSQLRLASDANQHTAS